MDRFAARIAVLALFVLVLVLHPLPAVYGQGAAGKQFKDVDVNKDGKVDISEFTVIMMTVSPEWFKQFDRDGNGYLDEAEFNALMRTK